MHTFTVTALLLVASTSMAAATSEAIPTPAPQEASNPIQPWYVKHASNEIVNFCCLGGMFGGGYSIIGNGGPPAGGFSTISFSSLFTRTFDVSTATTLTTTIPGSVITIFGSPGLQSTSTVSPVTQTSVLGPLTTAAVFDDARPTERGLAGFIEGIENYAHAVADAVVAPAEMTALLSSAADEIMNHGYIHPTNAQAYVTQANRALDALKTDSAYSAQSAKLASQPTHINFEKAFAVAKQSHSVGIERFLSDPQGRSVGSQIRKLATSFLNTFAH